MTGLRKSSTSRSSKTVDHPKMKDNTLSSEPPFMFNAVDTDYPIARESNEMTQQERRDLFPQFLQREADRLRVEDSILRDYLLQFPVGEFSKFNEHHIDTDGEIYDHRKYTEGSFIGKRKENGEKEETNQGARQTVPESSQSMVGGMSTDKHEVYQRKDSKISQRTLKRLKERCHIKDKEKDEDKGGKSGVFPNFLHGTEGSYKHIDEDNTETDEEKDENNAPWYKLSEFSLLASGRTKEVDQPEVFPFFDPTASGNVPVEKVSEVRGNAESLLASTVKMSRANGFREERRGIRHMGGFISGGRGHNIGMRNGKCVDGKDFQMLKSTPCEPVAISDSDEPFQTEVSYSSERDGEIIESEPVTDHISVINKIFKAPPEEPKFQALKFTGRKTVALPSMFKRGWSQSMNHAGLKKAGKAKGLDKAKSLVKGKEIESYEKPPMELTGYGLILWHRQKALKLLIGDSPGEDVKAILRNSPKGGTKDLENQVYRMTSDVPHLRTCYIVKSNSVRSVRPIIENAPGKARSVRMAHGRVTELQRTGHWPSPIPEEDEQDSFSPHQHPEQFCEPSSSNNPIDRSSHSYKHTRPISEAALEDSSPFEVPGPFSKSRPFHPRNESIDKMIHSEEHGLPALEHTTKESLPVRRHIKRFDTPVSSTGKGTDSQSDLTPKEHADCETSTSMQSRKLRRSVKRHSLHQMFMKGFDKHEDYRAWEDKRIDKYKETTKWGLKRVIGKPKGCLKKHRNFRNWEDAWIDKKVDKFMGVKFSDTVKIHQGKRGEVAAIGGEGLEKMEERAKEQEIERARERAEQEVDEDSEDTINFYERSGVALFSYI